MRVFDLTDNTICNIQNNLNLNKKKKNANNAGNSKKKMW